MSGTSMDISRVCWCQDTRGLPLWTGGGRSQVLLTAASFTVHQSLHKHRPRMFKCVLVEELPVIKSFFYQA